MITDVFIDLINWATSGIPEVPPAPSWIQSMTSNVFGFVDGGLVQAAMASVIFVMVFVPGVKLARLLISLFSGGGAKS